MTKSYFSMCINRFVDSLLSGGHAVRHLRNRCLVMAAGVGPWSGRPAHQFWLWALWASWRLWAGVSQGRLRAAAPTP